MFTLWRKRLVGGDAQACQLQVPLDEALESVLDRAGYGAARCFPGYEEAAQSLRERGLVKSVLQRIETDRPIDRSEVDPATIVAVPGQTTRGTSGADVIIGTSGPDVIRGRGGEDRICSGRGDDRVCGGADQLCGGSKSDVLLGSSSADLLDGGKGRDECSGGKGVDRRRSCNERPSTPRPGSTPTPAHDIPGDTKDCGDFDTYGQAKAWYDRYFPQYGDVAGLDGYDNDGIPCEGLPGAPR